MRSAARPCARGCRRRRLKASARLARLLRFGADPPVSPGACSAVIVESDGALAAVGVDRLVGTESVVVRPLPELTPEAPAIAGASLDQNGDPQIVLDAKGLVTEASRAGLAPRAAPAV